MGQKRKLGEEEGGEEAQDAKKVDSKDVHEDTESPDTTHAQSEASGAPPEATHVPDEEEKAQIEKYEALGVSRAQWWYYKDAENNKQGPYYPGVMQGWYEAGYFPADSTLVAPSFHGEIPRQATFVTLGRLFPAPLAENAFKAAPHIAAFPPEEVPAVVYQVEEEETAEGGGASQQGQRPVAWLEKKLQDKRNGKRTVVGGGPVLKGSFVN